MIFKSFLKALLEIEILNIVQVNPMIKPILAMFEPIILPIAISSLPENVATNVTTNSGKEVPNATIVRPITSLDIPNFLASLVDPETIKSPPKYRRVIPESKLIKMINDSIITNLKKYNLQFLW